MSEPVQRKGLSFQAILMGFLVAVLGSIAVSIVISIATRVYLTHDGFGEAQIKRFFAQQFENIPYALIGLPGNWAVAALAGYMTAKTADRMEFWHALAMIVLVLLAYYGPTLKHVPIWFFLISAVGSIGAALAGARRYKRSKA